MHQGAPMGYSLIKFSYILHLIFFASSDFPISVSNNASICGHLINRAPS